MGPKQMDRAAGVLLASAAGDALGVPYEFGVRALTGEPEQLGGGLGGFAPGEWSDDTSMACAIAQVAATGADLRTAESLDAIAGGFLRWYADGPADIGNQTRQVLSRATAGPGSGARMTAIAAKLHELTGHTGGNGSLMRTGPVALAHLGDPDAIVQAARAVSDLTHPDPMAGDACALWCLAIDTAVRTGELDLRAGLPHVDPSWAALLDQAEQGEPDSFANNGWVVTALQASWSALTRTSNLRDALIAAVRAGNDTDTVAAITGALAGARYGGSTVPFAWRRRLHGWPGLRGRDLTALAVLAARGGQDDPQGWPRCEELPSYAGASTITAPHPDDPGVLLGAVGALQPGVADAVVSLCRLGSAQVPLAGIPPEDHAEAWMIDMEDANNDLRFAIRDAADAVHRFRAEGKTVLLHCVHAHTRTPVVAAAYGARRTGSTTAEALTRILDILPSAHPRPSIRRALEADTTASSPPSVAPQAAITDGFSPYVQEQLKCYVYLLTDPRDKKVFYVGKGTGNRVFAHARDALDASIASDKLDRIRDLRSAGLHVQYELLRFGLTSREAFEIEAAAMQLLNLEDLLIMASGHHVQTRGRMSVDVATSLFDAPPAPPITEPTLLIKIPQLWYPGIPEEELLRVTAGWWRLSKRREGARYAFAVQSQVIRQVYEIADGSWCLQRLGDHGWTPDGRPRWGFTGTIADDMDKYRNTNVKHLYRKGEASPVKYCNC